MVLGRADAAETSDAFRDSLTNPLACTHSKAHKHSKRCVKGDLQASSLRPGMVKGCLTWFLEGLMLLNLACLPYQIDKPTYLQSHQKLFTDSEEVSKLRGLHAVR